MKTHSKLVLGAALVLASAGSAFAQAGDSDDQFVITGCVVRSGDARDAGPHSMLVWSRGDVYLSSPTTKVKPAETGRPVGTTGPAGPVLYWIDDENDFAKHVGQRVEIVGELSDEIDDAELEIEVDGAFMEVEFDAGGREATARIPIAWFGPQTRGRDFDADVSVRTVDIEKVTVLGACTTR